MQSEDKTNDLVAAVKKLYEVRREEEMSVEEHVAWLDIRDVCDALARAAALAPILRAQQMIERTLEGWGR